MGASSANLDTVAYKKAAVGTETTETATLTLENGIGNFKLKDNEYITFILPSDGAQTRFNYEITELLADPDDYVTSINGDESESRVASGSVNVGDLEYIKYTNILQVADIEVSKDIYNLNTDEAFAYTATFADGEGTQVREPENFTLTNGESKILLNVPVGTTVTVKEDTGAYTAYYSLDGSALTTGNECTLTIDSINQRTIAFTNDISKTVNDVVVIDYAKPVEINVLDNDIFASDVTGLTVANAENPEDYHGKAEVANKKVIYTITDMQMSDADVFDYQATYQGPHGVSTAVTGTLTVLPANNIYYEDDFTTVTNTDDSNYGRVGIVYTGEWKNDGTTQNGTVEHPEGAAGDADGVHGWEDSLSNDTGYSDGSAQKGEATKDNPDTEIDESRKAEATFTFTGTGVDVYSRTNGNTGTILATLRGGEVDADGYYEVSKTLIVDTLSESGDYYQIPTLSFMDLPYDTYTVTIRVTTAAEGRFIYYLDGIRVYNPMQEQSGYAPEERNAIFKEVRDMLLDAKSFDVEDENTGVVFIDSVHADQATGEQVDTPTTTTDVLGIYEDYGPKNEVYLKAGQSITFRVKNSADRYYYIGLKAPNINGNENGYSGAANALVSDGTEQNKSIEVAHSTDLYYKVVPDAEGYITIKNNGGGLLSVTKIRATGNTANGIQLQGMTEEEALEAVKLFSARPVVDTEEKPVDPNAPVEPEQPDVEIDNPTEPEQPGADSSAAALLRKMLKRLFTSLSGWFN